ncbi:MAG TPA: DUF1259 domain-containing protein [Acidobacteriaceae bacterium]|nr:DUF1259 domain-containing protein [Acidobacteriaceae bacterium]
MPALGFARLTRRQLANALALAVVFFSFTPQKASAAPDWSAIQTAMGASGTEMPGNVLRFELYRSDLYSSLTVNGVQPYLGDVANGFVAFKPAYNGQIFADGSLPAQETELNGLETALRTNPHIRITGVGSHVILESPRLIWVEFEAEGNGADLAASIATALATIHSPQLNVGVIPGTDNVFDPSTILPPNFLKLFDEGFVEQMDDVFVFYLPRPDEHSINLRDVRAEAGLGVGQSFYIEVPFEGGSNITIDIDFALRPEEVQGVEDILRAGGFTISSQANHYLDDGSNLQFVHATATGDGFNLATPLYNAIEVIRGQSYRHW